MTHTKGYPLAFNPRAIFNGLWTSSVFRIINMVSSLRSTRISFHIKCIQSRVLATWWIHTTKLMFLHWSSILGVISTNTPSEINPSYNISLWMRYAKQNVPKFQSLNTLHSTRACSTSSCNTSIISCQSGYDYLYCSHLVRVARFDIHTHLLRHQTSNFDLPRLMVALLFGCAIFF